MKSDFEFLYKVYEQKRKVKELAKLKGSLQDKEVLEKTRKLEKMILDYLNSKQIMKSGNSF